MRLSPNLLPSTAAKAVPLEPFGEPASGPLTMPDDAGPGWVRSAMHKAAEVAATGLAAGPVLAVAASRTAVLLTVTAGDAVWLHVDDVRYGTSSLTLTIVAWIDRSGVGSPEMRAMERAVAADYTYIAVGAGGLPRPILEPVTKACDDPASDDAGDEKWTQPT